MDRQSDETSTTHVYILSSAIDVAFIDEQRRAFGADGRTPVAVRDIACADARVANAVDLFQRSIREQIELILDDGCAVGGDFVREKFEREFFGRHGNLPGGLFLDLNKRVVEFVGSAAEPLGRDAFREFRAGFNSQMAVHVPAEVDVDAPGRVGFVERGPEIRHLGRPLTLVCADMREDNAEL